MPHATNRSAAFVAAVLLALPAYAADRVHYIAAEEVAWDYAPEGRDLMMGMPFGEDEGVFVARSSERIGRIYKKAVFRAYTDESFATPQTRSAEWQHLGMLGPIIHAEVGDTIRVVFHNKASRPYTMHPHGVFYDKASEGAAYADGTDGADKADDAVAPGATYTYTWEVPERAGPGPADPSSIVWLYHSHVSAPPDTNAGLVGAIVVTAKGMARADGRPADVDREFLSLFAVMDENASWYLDENIASYADAGVVDVEDDDFVESNLMHAINGFVYGNLPGLEMREGERVRWYAMALGTEVDLHTPHWHGGTLLQSGNRVDTVNLLPATTLVADMVADSPGVWMYHCHVNDHIAAGMSALYSVAE